MNRLEQIEARVAAGPQDHFCFWLPVEQIRDLLAVAKAAIRLQRDGYACTPARVEMDEALSVLLKEA